MLSGWKIFRISRPKSAWSCETNMSSAIDQVIRHTTRAGESSRSSFARREGSLPSQSIPRRVTTLPAINYFWRCRRAAFFLAVVICAIALPASSSPAQIPISTPPPPPPSSGQDANAGKQGSNLVFRVNLVVLHTTVLDDRQRFADGLKLENFRVFEDKVEQKLSVFRREDLPVSMGLVIDNSGSMRDKRPRVNEA